MPIFIPPSTATVSTSWFRAQITTSSGFNYDVSKLLKSVSVTRGKTSNTENSIAAAACTCTFDDTTGTFDADNSSSPLVGRLTVGPSSTTTFRLDCYVSAQGAYVPQFTGPFDSLERTFTSGLYSESTATFVDSTPELSRHIPSAGTVLPAELPGSRINRLLVTPSRSGALWNPRALIAPTAIDTGQKMLAPYTCDGSTSSWRIAEGAAQAEGGLLFFDGAGVLTFHGQSRRLVQSQVWTFSDVAGAIHYEPDFKFRTSTDDVIDDAAVTTADDGITSYFGPQGPFSDQGKSKTGANPFKDKVNTVTVDLTETSQLAGQITGSARAQFLYGSRMPPRRQVPALTLNAAPVAGQWTDGSGHPTAYQAAVAVRVDDLVLVVRQPAGGGSTISESHWVEGYTLSATSPDTWTNTLNVSRAEPIPTGGYWELGVSELGVNNELTW